MPTTIPGQPEQDDDREQDAGKADREVVVAARVSERAHEQRREQDEERRHAAEDEQRQPEERRGDTPRPLALALLQQVAEHRHERTGQRGVREERAHDVGDEDRDRERVDEAGDAEEVRAHHLADETEDARDRGSRREDGRGPRDAAAVTGVGERRRGVLWLHGALRFSQWGLLPSRGPQPRALLRMANIKQQRKRVRIQERQRGENLRYRSTIKTLTKRLETAVSDGDAERVAAEYRELVRTIDRAATRGALHGNTAARKKSRAARLASGVSS